MARKKKTAPDDAKKSNDLINGLKPETRHSIAAIFAFLIAAFFTLAAFGKAGLVGNSLYRALDFLFGKSFFLLPLISFFAGLSLIFSLRSRVISNTLAGGVVLLLSALGIIELLFGEKFGGRVGFLVSLPLLKLFDFWASLILLFAFFAISIIFMFNISLKLPLKRAREDEESFEKEIEKKQSAEIFEDSQSSGESILENVKETLQKFKDEIISKKEEAKAVSEAQNYYRDGFELKSGKKSGKILRVPFEPPPLDFFESDKGKSSSGDIKANANIIKRTLQNFGIDVEMNEVNVGPSVAQYTLKPAEGVKLARITALHNDLALALAAHPIRIEAPIPGRPLVGIEIPNRSVSLVGLKGLFMEEVFQKSEKPLILALGRDVTNKAVFADLARMPHLLIAGSTGSGKSVCIHAIITSLLYRNPPDRLRFLLFDPKRVELTIYRGIPHLLTDVIVDPKKTISALRWAVKEMERRYDILSSNGTRDIHSYHSKIFSAKSQENDYDPLPYILIVIDELADVMGVYPRELEAVIVRLAQMSRAVGVHLILSTQRPSVEVITGLIKANITSRIAFQVASQVDSRTILDRAGAEKLLGNGDMLYLAGDAAKPRRLQGAYVTETEVRRVANYLSQEYPESEATEAEEIFGANLGGETLDFDLSDSGEVDDELYESAKAVVIQAGKASASYLQRRLRIGYARAARLLDIMEERGLIGPTDGAKPREVLIKSQEDDNSDTLDEDSEK